MSPSDTDGRKLANAGALAAGVMIAQQVAGKATRDAIFLSEFDISLLPPMVLASAFVSVIVALLAARALTRHGPDLIVPATFGVSALLFAAQWGVFQASPQVVAVTLYLHMAVLGGILISAFWSLVNERFDPHTAKKTINRIAGGATLGGLLGGLAAERVAAMLGAELLLPLLALMHAFCGWRVMALTERGTPSERRATAPSATQSGLATLASMPYLRLLALLLTLTTVAAGLVDFVFKAQADAAFAHDPAGMLRFFAAFYTAVGLLAFLAQFFFARIALERLGLARSVAALPAVVVALGGAVIALPGLIAIAILRGLEDTTRNSVYRSGYELLYTPVPRADKRATKLIIDVGFDRLGDAIGAGIVAALLVLGPGLAYPILIGLAMALSAAALALTVRIHRGYVGALENSLLHQAEALDLSELEDRTTRTAVLQTLGSLDLATLRDRAGWAEPAVSGPSPGPPTGAAPSDPVTQATARLRSAERARVLSTLRGPLDPATMPHVVALLAWDGVKDAAVAALAHHAPAITGLLTDALLDPESPFAVRRRIPRALRHGDPGRASAGLIAGLADRRFEVRYQCARALRVLARRDETLHFVRRDIYAIVDRELQVSDRVWRGHRLLDAAEPVGDGGPDDQALAADLAMERVNRGLEHVFTLLALVLPDKPVRIAFRGLHTDDPALRGTALEYLDSALPESIRARMRAVVQRDGPAASRGPAAGEAAAQRLIDSMASIDLNLSQLRAQLAQARADETQEPG